MKGFVTHAVSLLVGFLLAAFVFLYLAKLTSIVWQNNLKGSITYLLQVDGAKAARAKDWARAQYAFQASEKIESNVKPREWDGSLPIYGWSTVGIHTQPRERAFFDIQKANPAKFEHDHQKEYNRAGDALYKGGK